MCVPQNRVEEAVQDFDRVLAEEPRMKPYLWQRGLALYYLGRFEDAATQFREDVAVNPNDTEEVGSNFQGLVGARLCSTRAAACLWQGN
jgi:tetratricopeptide (TPR) repeat protein